VLTYAVVCLRFLAYAGVCWRMLAYAGVWLTYAGLCWRMLTYADVWRRQVAAVQLLLARACEDPAVLLALKRAGAFYADVC
jgi:hypothetical protein